MTKQTALRRVKNNFWNELVEINEIRQNLGKEKITYVKLTSLIPKHSSWKHIKKDAINLEEYDDE